jgi:hypothetical protein
MSTTIKQTRLRAARSYLGVMEHRNHSLKPKDKAERFQRCPACGGYFNLCDADQVFDHLGPLPHPAEAQPR